jgi:outer membrane protein OmpA-like peptidoglycan-associated protein
MKKYLSLLLVPLLLVTLGFTQNSMENVSIGLKGGASTYFGDIDEQHIAPYAAFSTDAWLSEVFALGVLIYAGHLQAEEIPMYFESSVYGVGGMLKIAPFGKSPVSPYLYGGLEAYSINPEDGAGNKLPNNLGNVYPKVRLGYPVGAGIMFFLNEGLSIDIEGLYHLAFTDYIDDFSSPDKDDGYVTGSIGLTWHLGGPKDTDGDGISDKLDADPLRAEDFDGFMDSDGAPDLDNDEDGVPDSQDKAPLEAEDRDGFQDNDGVPDPDNDGDGILDVSDKAPLEAEDKDGFQDEDGAPDLDNDGDGIADVDDQCPNEPETKNGYEDNDGCPDTKPEIVVEKGESIVLEGVFFQTGSAQLTPNSRIVLDKVVRTLRDNPEIEVEIHGHTDNTGGLQVNYRLSERRAESVKNYLVQNGISSTRVSTKGFGPEKPIEPNSTSEGRAKNRRIEFYRVK